MSFEFQRLEVAPVVLVRGRALGDARGSFSETYRRSAFSAHGIDDEFVQDNMVVSAAGVLRGLHYQLEPQAQAKLVRVLRGAVFDVVVDLRRGSPSFAAWVGVTLTAGDHEALYVPPGFAHGYCVVGDGAVVAYKASAEYAPELERGIRWNDPQLGIDWPLAEPVLSARDAALPSLADAEHNFAAGGN